MDADWSREQIEGWQPSRRLLKAIRDYQRHQAGKGLFSGLLKKVAVLRHRFWMAVSGAEIQLTTQIGGGLIMPHPGGIVIHPGTTIGVNCLIMQGVTIGTNVGSDVPRIGNQVNISPGACVMGGIRLGDGCMVGANAVVLQDVPPGALAIGVPAKIVTEWKDRRGT